MLSRLRLLLAAVAVLALTLSCTSDDDNGAAPPSESASKSATPPTTPATTPPPSATPKPRQVYAFPSPGTPTASPTSEISLRGVQPDAIGTVTVTGEDSGDHPGKLMPHSDNEGASFVPDSPFSDGEKVTVKTDLPVAGARDGTFDFTVAVPGPELPPSSRTSGGDVPDTGSYASRPDLRPPLVNVERNDPGSTQNEILINPKLGGGQEGPMIVSPKGQPLWFDQIPSGQNTTELKVQQYKGKPVLTWWQGEVPHNFGVGACLIYDDTYSEIAKITGGNGYQADLHDCDVSDRNTLLITAYSLVHWDLSSIGGPKDGVVVDGVVQEIDIPTGRVLFEWHSLAHVSVADSYIDPPSDVEYDYFHLNSIDEAANGDLLISGRNTWATYELDRQTGAVKWTLGGKSSDFKMRDGSQFAYQHDAIWQDGHTMSIFDNGAGPVTVHPSRGLLLNVDQTKMEVTIKRQFNPPAGQGVSSHSANMQVLPNGNAFICWGPQQTYTESTPDGKIIYLARLPGGYNTYRAYTQQWVGKPTSPPDAVVTDSEGGKVTVAVSWNGATEVDHWQLYAGTGESDLEQIGSADWESFETDLTGETSAPKVQVRAYDKAGNELGRTKLIPTSG